VYPSLSTARRAPFATGDDHLELDVLEAEPSRVAHLAPDPGLGHRQELADVVSVVVDPFAEELVHAEWPDIRMEAGSGEVAVGQPADEAHTLGAELEELIDQLAGVP
jgi:hypothetical protein